MHITVLAESKDVYEVWESIKEGIYLETNP
jgi:hypothetical protein